MLVPEQAPYDVVNSKPKMSCVYCKVSHYVDDAGNPVSERHAECTNPVVSLGCVAIDISADANPFNYTVNCKNCKHFSDRDQLSLF